MKKHIKDIIVVILILIMLFFLAKEVYFPPVRENKRISGLPVEAYDICSSGNPSYRWIECKMSEEIFLQYMKSRKLPVKKFHSDIPLKIRRYTMEKFPERFVEENKKLLPQDENVNSLIHFTYNGYMTKIQLFYIIYDLDKKMYYEEIRR
jgi:hypothetical protein